MFTTTPISHDEILKQIREWLDSVSIAHTVRPKDQNADQFHFIIDLAIPQGVTIFINKIMPDRFDLFRKMEFWPST